MSTARTTGPVLWDVDARGVAHVVLNRPEVNNAYNGELIDADAQRVLTATWESLILRSAGVRWLVF